MENSILFGNGINLPNEESTWDGILKGMASDDSFLNIKSNTLKYEYIMLQKREFQKVPYLCGGHMLLGGHFNYALRANTENDILKKQICQTLLNNPPTVLYDELPRLNINNYLTTNYELYLNKAFSRLGYSVEENKDNSRLFMYYYAKKDSDEAFIFNIHGDVTDRRSLVLGFNQYSKSVVEIENLLEAKNNGKQLKKNWIDTFLNSNLYIIGFGLSEDEIDLWDILVYRKRMNRRSGAKMNKITYFDISGWKDIKKQKILYGFDIDSVFIDVENKDWSRAYKTALFKIGQEVGYRIL